MTEALLTLLRWCLLGLLYLFFFRVLQVTWAGSRASAALRGDTPSKRGKRGRSGPPKLVVLEPPSEAGREIPVNGEVIIGRAASCAVTLDDTYLSQHHVRISADNQGVAIEDLGSTNGTYLNRQRITTKVFGSPGDQLQLGGIVLELR